MTKKDFSKRLNELRLAVRDLSNDDGVLFNTPLHAFLDSASGMLFHALVCYDDFDELLSESK